MAIGEGFGVHRLESCELRGSSVAAFDFKLRRVCGIRQPAWECQIDRRSLHIAGGGVGS